MAKLLAAPTKNAVQKTLAAQLLSTATTGDPITFDDVDGIPNLPGVLVINRVNTSGTATPSSREYIEYSGTSGSTVLITTRNVDGSNSALTHPVGSIVEFIPDVVWADRIYDSLALLVDVTDTSVVKTALLTGDQTIAGVKTFSSFPVTPSSSPTTDYQVANKAYVDADIQTATDGATVTFDLGTGANRKHKVTLGGNRTLAISNAKVGQVFIIDLIQDATGSRTVTWFSTIKWAGGSAPTLTTTANKIDTFGFICTSSGNYQGYVVGQNL